jgi:hypothetical protein
MKSLVTTLALTLLAVGGCGPVYQTVTDYEPPENPTARAGLSNCEVIRMQCAQIEEGRAQTCQRDCLAQVDACKDRAEAEYQRCMRNPYRLGPCSRDKCPSYCGSATCQGDLSGCQDQYDRCYTAAGGTVTKRTVCVARCKNASVAGRVAAEDAEEDSGDTGEDGGELDAQEDAAPPKPKPTKPVKARKGKALDDDACLASDDCERFGRCSAVDGACAAANHASCRQSLTCKLHKKCRAKDGACVR